jgi:DNA-directed RNA polymerase specialized sigma24 family protein
MLRVVTKTQDGKALEVRIRGLLAELGAAAGELEELEDDADRAVLSHLLIGEAYGLNLRQAPVRQAAVRALRERRGWAHSDVARLLRVPLPTAGRIANKKLKPEAE